MKGLGTLVFLFSGVAAAASYQCELRGHHARISVDPAARTITIENEWGTSTGLYVTHASNRDDYDYFRLGSLYGPGLAMNRTRAADVQFTYCWGCDPYTCRAE